MTELIAQSRVIVSKKENKHLREKGKIPAVLYGKTFPSTPIVLDHASFMKAWGEAGESTVLTVKGLSQDVDVLIQDVAIDPVREIPLHVDLYVVDSASEVEVKVPLVFHGVAPAEKELGGTLIKVLHELTISALPKYLPHEIVVDISVLKDFETQIHAGDVVLPPQVTLINEPNEVVALVSEAAEEEPETLSAVDLSAIEVSEQKGKKEEESIEGKS